MSTLDQRLTRALKKRELDDSLRKLGAVKAPIDFFSNDYLGLARNPALQHQIREEYDNISEKITGATGSRLLSGNNLVYDELERNLSKVFNGENCLIFNSGYTANLAIFSSIPQKGDTIIYDELIHACIKEGSRLSFADRFSFKHNDVNDLEAKLRKAKGIKFVAIESVYSMDGDFAPIREIVEIALKYDAYLIVDEAHGTGVFGKNGSGLISELGLEDKFYIRTYTFGKAIGSHGACVISNPVVNQYLINFARSFIYTTGLPLHNLITLKNTFQYLAINSDLQAQLKKRIDFFRERISEAVKENSSIDYIRSESAIQAIIVPGVRNVKSLSNDLVIKGFDVRAILPPTVQEGRERLRICLHVYNSLAEIKSLIEAIKDFKL